MLDPASWLRFTTSEIWWKRRCESLDGLVSEEGRHASDALKIPGVQR
jgi:hypothetical protein